MFFEVALNILISSLERAIKRRKEKGKSNKFLRKAFSEKTQLRVAQFFEVYTTLATELEDELEGNE